MKLAGQRSLYLTYQWRAKVTRCCFYLLRDLPNAPLFNLRELKECMAIFRGVRQTVRLDCKISVSLSVYISHSIILIRIIHIYMLQGNANYCYQSTMTGGHVSQRPKRDRLIWKCRKRVFRTTYCDSVSTG